FEIKPASFIGAIFSFIFISALISPLGGAFGALISNGLKSIMGSIATFIILFALSVISLLVTFNTSIKSLRERFAPTTEEKAGVKVHGHEVEPKVSVFTTMKEKVIGNKNAASKEPTALTSKAEEDGWEFPPLELLELPRGKASSGNIAKNVEIIQKSLGDFNIDVSMGDVNIGPTVTQYTLKPAEGVKLNQITARANDLALALAAHPLRIEAPIPGKAAVGVEIPNKIPAVVTLREIIESDPFKKRKSNLTIALGRDVAGNPVAIDLKKMPHLLIAGSTGSGKSICLNGLINSFLYQNSPAEMRLIMVDPKRVEFTRYNGIPHLLAPVVTEVDKTVNVLKWAVAEMDRRFKLFAETKRRDIESYNDHPPDGKLPYLVVVIDELADLMAQSAREVEAAIVRLAQMARATGIHLVVATQRPSVDVITGLIKANIISRIAFAVASQIDSRTILDMSGAEKLLGHGDMLYIGGELGKPKRVQGVMITEREVKAVTDFLKRGGQAQYDDSIINYQPARVGSGAAGSEVDDALYEEAKQVVVQAGKASASLLQRRLRVGYARAARLLDVLEAEGVIGQAEGAKPRDVLIGPEILAMQEDIEKKSSAIPNGNLPPVDTSEQRQQNNIEK
ncbi:MAG: DNA translocase FtsK, partial [Patescibacteria group bacterium]|nr:DNA translocase FtsK [Patescibacteria group bacterium]